MMLQRIGHIGGPFARYGQTARWKWTKTTLCPRQEAAFKELKEKEQSQGLSITNLTTGTGDYVICYDVNSNISSALYTDDDLANRVVLKPGELAARCTFPSDVPSIRGNYSNNVRGSTGPVPFMMNGKQVLPFMESGFR